MKSIQLIFLLFCAAVGSVVAQTAHYVSLYPTPGPNRYTSVQAAVDASSAGDTVYVEPGSYTEFVNIQTDSLVILGAGWLQQQVDTLITTRVGASIITRMYFRGGASTTVRGVTYTDIVLAYDSTSVNFNSCHFRKTVGLYTSRIIGFYGCVFSLTINPSSSSAIITGTSSNPLHVGLYNCLFPQHSRPLALVGSSTSAQSVQLQNCVFRSSVQVLHTSYLRNTNVQNCIFGSNASATASSTFNNSVNNSVFIDRPYAAHYGAVSSVWNVTEAEVFEASGPQEFFYRLAPNSPAIGAGTGGTDCGIFGGSAPFVLGGIPPIPWVRQLNVNASGSQGGGVDVGINVTAQ